MKRRFVLMTDGMTPQQEKQLAAALAPPLGWWHQTPNSWLIVDPTGRHTADLITGMIAGIAPNCRCLVVEVQHKWWASRLRTNETGAEQWLTTHWQAE